ncbi:MAG: HEPN domain-containing protein [Bernardetiaceae bacterium]|nr:HEPN domain-containing protein [Bernardetiaceae bacterium]
MNAENGLWNVVVNRLYYAAFYIVTALLIKHGYTTTTHKGVKILFAQHFIKTGIVSTEHGFHFSQLFDKRQIGDYIDFADYDKQDIKPLIKPTENFIAHLKKVINL